jgi:AcrR family transcriptional regulator
MRAALDLVDRDGLENLSMRRLGSELSVEAMALYHYVPTKAALLVELGQSVVENAVRKAAAAADGGRTWNDRLYRFALALHGELLLHPGALSILVSRPIHSPESVRLLDGVAGRLRAERDDRARVKRLVGAIIALALGHAVTEAVRGLEDRHRNTADRGTSSGDHAACCGTRGQDANREDFLFALEALLNGVEPPHAPPTV